MSYCVHCGVKLTDNARECPLCRTPVYDPARRAEEDSTPSRFPAEMAPPRRFNVRFYVFFIGLLLLIPLAAVIIIDILANHNLTWSLYVLGAEFCLWVIVVFPIFFSGRPPYLYLGADTLAVAGYTLLIFCSAGGGSWYLRLALPLILSLGGALLLGTMVCRNRRINKIEKAGWLTVVFSILLMLIDFSIYSFVTGRFFLSWSFYIAFPLLIFSIVLLSISHSVKICDWIRRKLFL